MKKMFIAKLAVAAVLAIGSLSQAQEDTAAIPAIDAPTAVVQADDAQASVSDNVSVEGAVQEVAPVEPISETVVQQGVAYGAPMVGNGCVGCGQNLVMPATAMPMVAAPLNTGCSTGCSACSTGCNSCGVQTATYAQPMTTGCCGSVGQVSYNQPLYQTQTPTLSVPASLVSSPTTFMSQPIVNPAPAPVVMGSPMMAPQTMTPQVMNSSAYTPVTGCSSCGSSAAPVQTMNYAPANYSPTVGTSYFNGCNDCNQSRGRLRGRLFRNR